VVAIEGKTLLSSSGTWAIANSISLGQVVVDQKSNEITAIPALLEILDVSGCLDTIDAMGRQREIAQKIVDAKADYVLEVKDNQPRLHGAIHDFFSGHLEDGLQNVPHRRNETHEQGHGRRDDRYYYLAKPPKDVPLAEQWPGLNAIGMAVHATEHDDGRTSDDVRYYIASRYTSGRRFAEAVRGRP
jgi:predicted transposase YbfD/YdcC